MAITGIHHAAIRVADFDRSFRFYTEVLGMTPKVQWTFGDQDRRATMLDTGDGNYIELFERPGENAPADSPEPVLLHVALRTDALDADLEAVRAEGLTVTMEPTDIDIANTAAGQPTPVPIRIAFFKGPDGEVIELFQNELT